MSTGTSPNEGHHMRFYEYIVKENDFLMSESNIQ